MGTAPMGTGSSGTGNNTFGNNENDDQADWDPPPVPEIPFLPGK
jgi:hypothetical protein